MKNISNTTLFLIVSLLYLLFVIKRSRSIQSSAVLIQASSFVLHKNAYIYYQRFTTPRSKFTISFYFLLLLILFFINLLSFTIVKCLCIPRKSYYFLKQNRSKQTSKQLTLDCRVLLRIKRSRYPRKTRHSHPLL